MTKLSVLLVEDDESIAEIIGNFMHARLIELEHHALAANALKRIKTHEYQCIILDLNLPDMYGIDLCKQIRQFNTHTPILILSANVGETNRIIGLEAGANDYLEKPFNLHELYARIKSLAHIAHSSPPSNKESTKAAHYKALFNGFSFDISQKALFDNNNKEVSLSKTESDILAIFITRYNQLITKYDIAEALGLADQSQSRSVEQMIGRIRQKINDPSGQVLRTIRGYGYIFLGSVTFK